MSASPRSSRSSALGTRAATSAFADAKAYQQWVHYIVTRHDPSHRQNFVSGSMVGTSTKNCRCALNKRLMFTLGNCAKTSRFHKSNPPTRRRRIGSWKRKLLNPGSGCSRPCPKGVFGRPRYRKTRRPCDKGGYTDQPTTTVPKCPSFIRVTIRCVSRRIGSCTRSLGLRR